MNKLIELKKVSGDIVYINPSYVVAIEKSFSVHDGDYSRVHVLNRPTPYEIDMLPVELVRLITNL